MNRRNARFARKLGKFIDIVNIILGTGIVLMGILILAGRGENRILFPILFLSEAAVNVFLAIKEINCGETGRFIALAAAAGLMLFLGIFAFFVVL